MTTLATNFWQTIGIIFRLLRWDKPAGRLILMIPALWAVFLAAKGTPPLGLIGVIVLGTLATSGVGCVVNDLWDRNLDPLVERTKHRPLADRSLSIVTGIIVGLISLLCAAGLSLYLNPLTFWLCVAAVPVILFYPSAKRFFPVPQLVLSIAWGFAVLISWTAVSCSGFSFSALRQSSVITGLANFACIPDATWWLWGATILWTLGFDTVYAMSDRADDLKIGINSSAIFFGKYAAIAVGLCFAATAGLLAQLGWVMNLHIGFWISLGGAIALWGWQFYRLSRPLVPAPVYPAIFRQNVWIGFILLGGMITGIL